MIIDNNHILPSEGYAYISNGSVLAKEAYLGRSDSPSNWYDTNDEPPKPEEPITPEQIISRLEEIL